MRSWPDIPRHPRIQPAETVLLDMSGCWRGYRGTWESRQGRLYLVHLEGLYRLVGQKPLFADGYSGELCIAQGRTLRSSIFSTTHEAYRYIIVENGTVTGHRSQCNA